MSNKSVMSVVHVVQNRAPTELTYLVDTKLTGEFIDKWRDQNPDHFISAQIFPLVPAPTGKTDRIPVTY